jgi:stress-induced morphogen
MPITQKELENILLKSFPNAEIAVNDLAGDNDHYEVKIIDKIFIGKTLIAQHKMVNQALDGILGGKLHALKIKTAIPD